MLIAIISDTHMPRGKRRLPDGCVEQLRNADLILHAGDICTLPVLRELIAIGPPVQAIHGNVDDASVQSVLPGTIKLDAGGARIAMTHDAGPSQGRLARMRERFPEANAVIFGHSHLPSHETGADGFQIFNPGSPTERRRAPEHTMGLARVHSGSITFEHVVV
jgi:putative phosphoesterase